jgi:transcriptional regulator with XRE-family HTH domain
MPAISDHPLRQHRQRVGVGQVTLARQAGLNRATVSAIEEGRSVTPTPETLRALEQALGLPPTLLEHELEAWQASRHQREPILTPSARILLQQRPTVIATFPSFVAWRQKVAPTPTAFASILGVNRGTVAEYERGIRQRGMSVQLAHALLTVFGPLGLTQEYLKVLQQLPPSEE